MSEATPTGFLAIVTNPTGAVVAKAVDFERQTPGGCTLAEGQRSRIFRVIKYEFARQHLNMWMAERISEQFANVFWLQAESSGYKLHLIEIGDRA